MLNQIKMEESSDDLIQRLDQNARKPAYHITWNRFLILMEKCMLINRNWWLLTEIVLVAILCLYSIFPVLMPFGSLKSNNSFVPGPDPNVYVHWPAEQVRCLLPSSKLYFSSDANANNQEDVHSFMTFVQKSMLICGQNM